MSGSSKEFGAGGSSSEYRVGESSIENEAGASSTEDEASGSNTAVDDNRHVHWGLAADEADHLSDLQRYILDQLDSEAEKGSTETPTTIGELRPGSRSGSVGD